MTKLKLKKKRKTPKQDKVLDRWSVVLKYRSQNVSWRDIEDNLYSKYGIRCSHVTLGKMYKKFENPIDND